MSGYNEKEIVGVASSLDTNNKISLYCSKSKVPYPFGIDICLNNEKRSTCGVSLSREQAKELALFILENL